MEEAKNSEDRRKTWREQKRRSRARLAMQDFPMGDFAGAGSNDLYIMRYDFDPCQTMGCKIGRSQSVALRARQLAEGHCFEMKVLRVYTGCGHLEPVVHQLLSTKRTGSGLSREWFDVSFDTAMLAIRLAKELHLPGALSDGESCSAQEENEPCTTTP
jgi:hypothetical protein